MGCIVGIVLYIWKNAEQVVYALLVVGVKSFVIGLTDFLDFPAACSPSVATVNYGSGSVRVHEMLSCKSDGTSCII